MRADTIDKREVGRGWERLRLRRIEPDLESGSNDQPTLDEAEQFGLIDRLRGAEIDVIGVAVAGGGEADPPKHLKTPLDQGFGFVDVAGLGSSD